jgi:hypothetical protein
MRFGNPTCRSFLALRWAGLRAFQAKAFSHILALSGRSSSGSFITNRSSLIFQFFRPSIHRLVNSEFEYLRKFSEILEEWKIQHRLLLRQAWPYPELEMAWKQRAVIVGRYNKQVIDETDIVPY